MMSLHAVAAGLWQARADYTELMPVAPIHSYAAVSVANVAATWCQYEALKYVSFPVQVGH